MDLEEIHTADSIMDVSENDWIDFVYIWILKRCGLSIDNPHFKQKKASRTMVQTFDVCKRLKVVCYYKSSFF